MCYLKKLVLILLITCSALSAQNGTSQSIKPVIDKNQPVLDNPISVTYIKKHLSKESPKLFLTPAIKKNLIARLKIDPLMQSYYQYLLDKSKVILAAPLPKLELEGFRFHRAHDMPNDLGVLSMVYLVDKNPKVLHRIDEILQTVCAFPNWNPQHFLDVSELAYGVSMAIDWVGSDLPASTVKLSKKALIEKALLPSFDTSGPRMYWINDINNWNAVNHGGMIIAALAVADENPELAAKTIKRALDKLPNSLRQYMPDGAHPEGASYWKFGTMYTVLGSNALTTALGQDFGISKYQGFLESGMGRLLSTAPSGQCFNFADSDGIIDGETYVLLSWFAAQTGDGLYLNTPYFKDPKVTEVLTLEDPELQAGPADIGRLASMGLIWLSQFNPQKNSELPQLWVADGPAPIAIFQSEKTDDSQFYFAAKGGSAQISHANMDAGTFIFELNGVRWAVDPGNQNYYNLNKINFQLADYTQNSERWSLLTKGNHGHSTITVNNERHIASAYAGIADFKLGEKPEFTLNLSQTLGTLVDSARRRFVKESNQSVLIEDLIKVNDSTQTVTWALMTLAEIVPTENGAVLKQDGKALKLSILSPKNVNISIVSLDPPPLKIDKSVKNLKRIEIRIPAYIMKQAEGLIQVRLSGE